MINDLYTIVNKTRLSNAECIKQKCVSRIKPCAIKIWILNGKERIEWVTMATWSNKPRSSVYVHSAETYCILISSKIHNKIKVWM